VGKTWVAAGVSQKLRRDGLVVAARKPAQSFEPGDVAPSGTGTDADALAAATGDQPELVCPPHRWYERAMAPPMAAAALGRPAPSIAELVDEIVWPSGVDIGLVESAGGVRAPLGRDGDTVDLARRLDADLVVLVADAGLGTLNLVRLSAAALSGIQLVVHLNRFSAADELHCANRDWLRRREGLQVVTSIDALAAELQERMTQR
jgi:dethiobiotin synthetase